MARTAITVAVTHEGKDVLLFGKTVSLLEQQAKFRALKGVPSNPEFAEVCLQESDGHLQIIRFNTPEAAQASAERRAGEVEAAKKGQEAAAKARAELQKKTREEAQAKIKASVEANQNQFAASAAAGESKNKRGK